jgi:hypothetical protein
MIVDHQSLDGAIAFDEQRSPGRAPVSGLWHAFRYTAGGDLATAGGTVRTLPDKRLEAVSTLVLAAQSGSGILPLIPLGKPGHFGSK